MMIGPTGAWNGALGAACGGAGGAAGEVFEEPPQFTDIALVPLAPPAFALIVAVPELAGAVKIALTVPPLVAAVVGMIWPALVFSVTRVPFGAAWLLPPETAMNTDIVPLQFTVLADVLTWTEEAPLVFCCGKPPPHSWALYRGPLQ